MAETIGTAYIQIEPSFEGAISKINSEMGSAGESGGSSFGSGFAKVLGGTGKAIAGAVAAGGAAVTAMGASFVAATSSVASYGDNIDKMSQKMGLSAQSYQEWDAVMQHSGTSMESMKSSMKTLANAAETGNKAFEELGITEEQIANMNQEQLFEATITALQQVEDDTQRTYLAGKVLGKGATELGALLNTSAEDTQAMRDSVRELGGVMSDDAVKAAAAYQDQLQDMQTAFSGLSRNLMAEFLPSVTEVMGGLTEIFSGNSDKGLGMISNGITKILDGMTEMLPQLMEMATTIVKALASAIVQNLPQIAETGMQIITELASYIIENLPMILETATQIVLQIALGIAQALPELIPTIVDVMLTIVDNLIDNIDLLVDCAIKLMEGLTLGIVKAIPILVEKAPEIITKLVLALINAAPKLVQAAIECVKTIANALVTYWPQLTAKVPELVDRLKKAFTNMVSKFVSIGKDIIEGIKKGISDAWDKLVEWFTGKLGDLIGSVKDFFGIESPSKLFADEVGRWIPAGIAEGIEQGMGVLDKTIDAMSNNMIDTAINTTLTGSFDSATADLNEGPDIDGLYNLLSQYLPVIAQGDKITLEGDAGRLFRLIQRESIRNTQIVGTGAVLAANT